MSIKNLFSLNSEDKDISLEEMKKQFLEMRQRNLALEEELRQLKLGNPETSAITTPRRENMPDKETRCLIKNLLLEIREYNGESNPDPFRRSIRHALSCLDHDDDKAAFVRQLIAQKIKGKAQPVADRVPSQLITDILAALDTAFGNTELSYEQLSEQRNNMRQGATETVINYIKRFEDVHNRIQISLDSVPTEYRDSLRYMEKLQHIKKFIRSLKPELELRLLNENFETLRQVFNEALLIDKNLREDEKLRQNKRPSQTDDRPKNSTVPYEKLRTQEKNENYYCKHCKIKGHSDSRCFKLNPELKRNSNFYQKPHIAESPPIECESERPSTSENTETEYAALAFW